MPARSAPSSARMCTNPASIAYSSSVTFARLAMARCCRCESRRLVDAESEPKLTRARDHVAEREAAAIVSTTRLHTSPIPELERCVAMWSCSTLRSCLFQNIGL